MYVPDKDHIGGVIGNWAINLQQPLVTFGRVFNALKIARVRDEFLEDKRQLDKDLFYLSVIQAFGNVFRAQSNIKLAEKSVDFNDKLLARIRIDLETGGGIKRDSLRIQAQVFKAESDLIKAQSGYRIAIKRLANLTELDISNNDLFIYNKSGWASTPTYETKDSVSLEYKLREYESYILKYNAEYEKGKLFPSINLTGRMNSDINRPTNKDIRDQLSSSSSGFEYRIPDYFDILDPHYWNFMIGIQMTWNIFDGRRSIASYRKSRYDFERTERKLKILREENKTMIKEAYEALITLEQVTKASDLQVETLRSTLDQLNIDFQGGFVDYKTILETEQQLLDAQRMLNELYLQRLLAVAQYKITLGLPLL
jgi:outer membrane protein TolC